MDEMTTQQDTAFGDMQPAARSDPQGLYPDYANPELLDKIPLTARIVLDVGCGQGALGAAYLRRNPLARVLGIESNGQVASIAAGRLSEVVCADAEVNHMPFAVPDGIDCIIYGDVLEHLRDPWAVLKAHAAHLAPGGTVLVCMPNVEHWSFAYRLLTGSFDYEDQGLLDRTHLRWFTPRMMGNALAQAGLELADVASRPIDQAGARQFVTNITPGLQALGINPAEYLNRAGPLQYIWRARKAAGERMIIHATMLEPVGGVSDVRVVEPIRALLTESSMIAGITTEPDLGKAATSPIDSAPKIAILHRPLMLGDSGIERLRALLRKNYIVVAEFDDHPIFMQARGVPVDQLLTFKGVHAVQTSTPVLAEIFRAENPEVGMFPNGIFELPVVKNFQSPDHLTLFFGALNREEDWAPLMPGLNEIARAVGGRLRFSVMHDQGFYDALETPHKTFAPMADYKTYIEKLSEAEIAFMPLSDNVFNCAKSDLKFIEASACRLVSLASDIVYAGSIEPNQTGLIFHNSMEMRAHLLRLLAYPAAARNLADRARSYAASQRMLAYQLAARIAWYRSLWSRREALNAALKARMPDLFAA